jgi:hypothetical protein
LRKDVKLNAARLTRLIKLVAASAGPFEIVVSFPAMISFRWLDNVRPRERTSIG